MRLTIAVPTLAVIFAALLNRNDVQSLRSKVRLEFQTFRAEVQTFRTEVREDLRGLREESAATRERIARIEERIGIKAAAS